MRRTIRTSIQVAALLAAQTTVFSQGFPGNFDIGVQAGPFVYQGDLTPAAAGSYKTPGVGLVFFADRIMNRSLSLRTSLAFAKIRSDDSKYSDPTWRQQRNFNFNARIGELSQVLVWNILGKNSIEPVRNGLAPYIFGGVGVSVLSIRPNADAINREWFASEPNVLAGLDEDLAHRLPRALPVFPVGVGVKYALTSKLSMYAETNYRFTTTDYLDGFSKSANRSRKDSYSGIMLGMGFKFGRNRYDCPVLPK